MVEFMEEKLIERKETGITILKKVGLLLLTLLVAYCIQFSSFVVYLLFVPIFLLMKPAPNYYCFGAGFVICNLYDSLNIL